MAPKLRIWDYESIAKHRDALGPVKAVPDSAARPGEERTEWSLRMLLKHLQTLAADAETLIRAHPPQIPAAEDLANGFDNYFRQAEHAVKEGLISAAMLDKVRAVDEKLSEMSDTRSESLWCNEGLRTRPEWVIVRRLAQEALEAMGYDLEPPPPGSM